MEFQAVSFDGRAAGYVDDAVPSHSANAAVVCVELAAVEIAGLEEVADMEGFAEAAWD